MKITILLQTYNELESGHLERFVKWNKELGDKLVALDDHSTDGTKNYLVEEFDLVLQTKVRSFNSELYNKQFLLESAKSKYPETDWFLWLDADELLLLSRPELNSLISSAENVGCDSISLPLVNLWKSEHYFRVDSKFDELENIRLWKNTDKLYYKPTSGLHQPLHPLGLTKTLKEEKFRVLHFGFVSFDLIVKKFATYYNLGQRGSSLWRLVNESSLKVSRIDSRFNQLGSRVVDYYGNSNDSISVTKNSIHEYFLAACAFNLQSPAARTKITLISLIYSGVDWLEFQYGELLKLASELPPGEVEILFVANDATPAVIDYLKSNGIPFVISPGRSSTSEWYINSVYRSYNYGVTHAKGDFVLLTNSDMAYSEGFLYSMIMESEPNVYLVGKLIESGRLKPAVAAIEKNLGKNLRNFKRGSFNRHSARLRKRGLEDGGLYMPALLHKETFLKFGGYPEGNLRKTSLETYKKTGKYSIANPGDSLIPGDFAFVSRLEIAGWRHKTLNSAIAYHFQEGEKSETKASSKSKISSGLAIDLDDSPYLKQINFISKNIITPRLILIDSIEKIQKGKKYILFLNEKESLKKLKVVNIGSVVACITSNIEILEELTFNYHLHTHLLPKISADNNSLMEEALLEIIGLELARTFLPIEPKPLRFYIARFFPKGVKLVIKRIGLVRN
jgi:hypothetical protein